MDKTIKLRCDIGAAIGRLQVVSKLLEADQPSDDMLKHVAVELDTLGQRFVKGRDDVFDAMNHRWFERQAVSQEREALEA